MKGKKELTYWTRSRPKLSISHDANRNPRLLAPSFFDNQTPLPDGEHLSPPVGVSPRSESGGSLLSFTSIPTVDDRGLTNYAAWESSHPQECTSRACQVSRDHRELMGSTPVTACSLRDAMCSYVEEGRDKFLPLNILKSLVNPTSVDELLKSENFSPEDREEIVQAIFGDCKVSDCDHLGEKPHEQAKLRRIFAILVLAKQVKNITTFIRNGLTDSVLPLSIAKKPRVNQTPTSGGQSPIFSASPASTEITKVEGCFAKFNSGDQQAFCLWQKMVHVPFFTFAGEESHISFYDLDASCALPFIEQEEPIHGGFGSVRKIHIHQAHHNLCDIGSVSVFTSLNALHVLSFFQTDTWQP